MHDAKIPVKEYEQLAKQFNPQKFNAEEWAQLAVDAGMKYLVFDCKHHDGFALYQFRGQQVQLLRRHAVETRSVQGTAGGLRQTRHQALFLLLAGHRLARAQRRQQQLGFPAEHEKDFDQYLRDKSMPQVKELLTNYGPIGLIWFDVPVMMTPERSKQLADLVRSIQPATLSTAGWVRGSITTTSRWVTTKFRTWR